MKKSFLYILPFIALLICTAGNAQFSYKVEGVVKENGKNLLGATATLTNDESDETKQDITKSSGTFSFYLKPNQEYSIFITKPGYIKVKIIYSTMGFSDDEAKKFKATSTPEVELFKIPDDPKIISKIEETLDKPMMSYIYNSDKKTVEADEEENQSMQKEFAGLQKLVEDFINKGIPLEAKYNSAVTKADKAFGLKNYDVAKDEYNNALTFKPNEQYPKTKLSETERIQAIAADNERIAKAKAEADAADKERLAKEKEQQLADATEKARLEKEAAAATEKEKLAKQKEIADAAEKVRLQNEKDKADAAEKLRLEKEKQLADAAEKSRLEKMKSDSIASEKQKLVDEKSKADAAEKQRIADEKAQKDGAEKERLAKEKAIADATEKDRLEREAITKALDKKHTAYTTTADSAISAQNYDVATKAFNEAIKLKPGEAYPKIRLADIEKLKADEELFKNDLAKKYPQGVTEEKVKENNMQVTRRILVVGNKGYLYTKKETTFGAVYYFKDGVTITEKEFTKDTELKK